MMSSNISPGEDASTGKGDNQHHDNDDKNCEAKLLPPAPSSQNQTTASSSSLLSPTNPAGTQPTYLNSHGLNPMPTGDGESRAKLNPQNPIINTNFSSEKNIAFTTSSDSSTLHNNAIHTGAVKEETTAAIHPLMKVENTTGTSSTGIDEGDSANNINNNNHSPTPVGPAPVNKMQSGAAKKALEAVNMFRQKANNPKPPVSAPPVPPVVPAPPVVTSKTSFDTSNAGASPSSAIAVTESKLPANDNDIEMMQVDKPIVAESKSDRPDSATQTLSDKDASRFRAGDGSSSSVYLSSTSTISHSNDTDVMKNSAAVGNKQNDKSSYKDLPQQASVGGPNIAVGIGVTASQGAQLRPTFRMDESNPHAPSSFRPYSPSNISPKSPVANNNLGPPQPQPQQAERQLNQDHSPPNNGPPRIRELKVEDALHYLDQVKSAFGDRPTIYNDFLEIMKNFKAMEIDTPGVIRRVSELFRGCNELILGFNTFLPEGFKIEQKDLEVGGHLSGYSSAAAVAAPHRHMDIDSAGNLIQPQKGMGRGQVTPNHGGNVFSHQFPGQQHGPGNNMPMNLGRTGHHPQNNVSDFTNMQHRPVGGNISSFQVHEPPVHPQKNLPAHVQQGQKPIPQDIDIHQQAAPHQPQQQPGQQPEFDHAISYVTTIKRRFAGEPRTYQQFLEILHTYQKEQRGIREVLEQVTSLFADHPDLLKEFTYFLPEAVQEQAKERLHAAAAEAEQRLFAARQQQEAARTADSFIKQQDSIHSKQVVDMTNGKPLSSMDIHARTIKKSPPQSRKRPHSPGMIPQQYQYQSQPETLVYNAAVERQFFDAAKEALTSFSRDGELAWGEFLKCMEMYAQGILNKSEMLSLMEDLLGKQHRDLLEEFKRILVAAGNPSAHVRDDAWHSVPLSDIDFSRCRRCTPSYRALPRDYPCPPFSERSEEEKKVLNDVWISLPDGSEESYTFRHMRKNQHEELLFRIEDERFEIDMVIDSNASALKRLEPIAEEIMILQQKELTRKGSQGSNNIKGAAGKVYKYSFDKRILNTIHGYCIKRIYGDSGAEMLELMYKNPVVAIPIVVKRLRQKDKDFRAAREVMNRRWKELAEIHYYQSLDHRSLTWRTVDKRATSTRTLATEIKDRAANDGVESEASVLARKDKAKDEHGSFYDVTMGRYLKRKMDLTNLPKPCSMLFTPHYSVTYDNNSWSQRDAYRIMSFALERGPISPVDKDKCHVVWRHFLSKFFGLSLMWMQCPVAAYTSFNAPAPSVVSNNDESCGGDDESSTEDTEMIGDDVVVSEEVIQDCNKEKTTEDNNQVEILDHQSILPGSLVLTAFGEGTIRRYRRINKVYEVAFPFGIGYLKPDVVFCSIAPTKSSSLTKQLMASDEVNLEREDDMFVIGPQCLYLFFRLHQILIQRLNLARKLAYSVDQDSTLSTMVEHMSPDGNVSVGQKRYEAFLSLVYGLVEGSYTSSFPGASSGTAEGGKYEDRLRCLLGHHAYELATMDKLISHILKNLQSMANDDTMQEMIQIFRRQEVSGGFKPMAFKQEAALVSEGENMYAFQYCKIPKSDRTILHMEFLGCIVEDADEEGDNPSMISDDRNKAQVTKKQRRS